MASGIAVKVIAKYILYIRLSKEVMIQGGDVEVWQGFQFVRS